MNVKCMYRIDVSMCPFLAYLATVVMQRVLLGAF